MGLTLAGENADGALEPRRIYAGVLITLYVLFEAPLSGMSMNPARTLGSAKAFFSAADLQKIESDNPRALLPRLEKI